MRKALLVGAILLTALPAFAQVHVATRSLGEMKEGEFQPGIEMNKLVAANPKFDVFVVTGRAQVGAQVTDYNKYVYDKSKRVLLMMSRTGMPSMPPEYRWRIWRDIDPTHFKDGLPYGKMKSEASPSGNAKTTVPLKYAGQAAITAWP
jgi:hypothetical protein